MRTPILSSLNVFYKINCKNCDSVHIGQTSRYLTNNERINGHTRSKRIPIQIPNAALSEHFMKEKHYFDSDNVQILTKALW